MSIVVLTEKAEQLKPFALANDPKAKMISKTKWFAHSNILNDDLVCAQGHLYGLDSPGSYNKEWEKWNLKFLPMFVDKFRYHLSNGRSAKLFKQIKEGVDNTDTVVLATDPDQEGELIGRLILQNIPNGLNKLKYRLWNSSLTLGASQKAFENLEIADKRLLLFNSGQSRQLADWLVGMNLSRLATLKLQNRGYQNKGGYSVGRVQTPILTILVNNNEEIENFKSKKYWQRVVSINGQKILLTNNKKYFNKDEAKQSLPLGTLLKIAKVEKKYVIKPDPKLYVLSGIQVVAAKKYGYSAKKTMSLIENMYLYGFTSYTRPDSHFINEDEFTSLKQNLSNYQKIISFKFKPAHLEPRKEYEQLANKISGHSALEATDNIPQKDDLTDEEWKIYYLIVRRCLLIFAPNFEFKQTKVIGIDDNQNKYNLTGLTITSEGYKKLLNNVLQDNSLPKISEGQIFKDCSFKLVNKNTTQPKRITQSQLIGKILPKYSLGTQATRAGLIDELINKKHYLKINKKQELFPTDQGIIVYDFMNGTRYTNPEATAKWDKEIKDIANGKKQSNEFLNEIKNNILETINLYKNKDPKIGVEPNGGFNKMERTKLDEEVKCPKCKDGVMELVSGKNKEDKSYKLYGCSNFQNSGCDFSLPSKWSGKEITLDDIKDLINTGKTKLKDFTSKKGKPYSAQLSRYNGGIG